MEDIRSELKNARIESQDLSLDNPLINYSNDSKSTLTIYDLDAIQLYNDFVNDNKSVSFYDSSISKSSDNLKTNLNKKDLQVCLANIYRSHKRFIEENGTNNLFLCVAFLHWIDKEGNKNQSPLILIPAEMSKIENSDYYFISYSGERILFNMSLRRKVKQEYNLELDMRTDEDLQTINEQITYVEKKLVNEFKEWKVDRNQGSVLLFDYGRHIIADDLDLSYWKDDKNFPNTLMQSLFNPQENNFVETNQKTMDPITDTYEDFRIYHANFSQREVLKKISEGENLIVEGAPGTGKVQTIANAIANATVAGKSVLFISKKKSALDSVFHLLEAMGLSDLVLELHTYKTNKKDVLKRIEKTLALGSPKNSIDSSVFHQYHEAQEKLKSIYDQIELPIANSEMTLSTILGKYLTIRDLLEKENLRIPKIFIYKFDEMSKEKFDICIETIHSFSHLYKELGVIEKHPLRFIKSKNCDKNLSDQLISLLSSIDANLNSLLISSNELSKLFNRPMLNMMEGYRYIYSYDAIQKYSFLENMNLCDYSIKSQLPGILKSISSIKRVQKFLKKGIVKENLFQNTSKFIFLYDHYQNEKKTEQKEYYLHLLTDFFMDPSHLQSKLKTTYNFIMKKAPSVEMIDQLCSIFKNLNRDTIFHNDWSNAKKLLLSTIEFQNLVYQGKILQQTKFFLEDKEKRKMLDLWIQKYKEAKEAFVKELNEFEHLSAFDVFSRFNSLSWYEEYNFSDLKKVISEFLEKGKDIPALLKYNFIIAKIYSLEIESILEIHLSTKKMKYLEAFFSLSYYEELINHAYIQYPILSEIKKARMDKLSETLQEFDQKYMYENVKKIIKKHYDSMQEVKDNVKEMNILRRETLKKRNQMPVRKLLARLPNSLQKIKPIFITSPISLSSFFMGSETQFDLVIFNESSRISAYEGLGGMLRAKQIVAFGDSQQFGPSTMLNSKSTLLQKNILNFLEENGLPKYHLYFHYRSLYSSLMNFVNKHYYKKQLSYYPSAYEFANKEGLKLQCLSNGFYNDEEKINMQEIKKIAKACLDHAKNHSNLSLGVVCLTLQQQIRLSEEIENLLLKEEDQKIKDFFTLHRSESFFVKDVFAAQGEIRDVIFISMVYAKDKKGNFPENFFALTSEYGLHSLNVALTCARRKCLIFSSTNIEELKTTNQKMEVFSLLCDLFESINQNEKSEISSKIEDSNLFLNYLSNKLKEQGYFVNTEIGKSYGIDIAVAKSELGPFILGIELDNGNYHQMNDLIDRENIRRQLLRFRGWRIYHVWTSEFAKNFKNEFEKLLDYLSSPIKEITPKSVSNSFKVSRKTKETSEEKIELPIVDYVIYTSKKRNSLILNDESALSVLIERIVIQETPIPLALLKKRIAEITNIDKLSDEESEIIETLAKKDERFELKGNFIYLKTQQNFFVRNRSKLEMSSRKVDYIPDEELEIAINYVLNAGLVATETELYKEIGNIFGFSKNERLTERLKHLVALLLDRGKLYLDNGLLYLND